MKLSSVLSTAKDKIGFSTIIIAQTDDHETIAKLSGDPKVVAKYTSLFLACDDMYEALRALINTPYEESGLARYKARQALEKAEEK